MCSTNALEPPGYRSLKEQVAEADLPDITDLPDIGSFAASEFGGIGENGGDDPGEEQFEDFSSDLEQTLTTGKFRLVVAAPDIDSEQGLQQVIEYLNSQGLQVYGLEVNFFKGPSASCHVPRLVTKPLVNANQKRTKAEISREEFLEGLHERVRTHVVDLIREAEAVGASVKAFGDSLSIRVAELTIVNLYRNWLFISVIRTGGNPHQPFEEAERATEELGVGKRIGRDRRQWRMLYASVTDDTLATAFKIALDLVGQLEPTTRAKPASLRPSESNETSRATGGDA